jgi:hypothetical protein
VKTENRDSGEYRGMRENSAGWFENRARWFENRAGWFETFKADSNEIENIYKNT